MDTRREFFKKSAVLAGATALSSSIPASILRAMAINPSIGSTYLDAEHVVILMQENRSFDHCFGTLRGIRGFNDPRAIKLPDENLVWLQSNETQETYAPFRFDMKDSKSTWMGDVPHSRSSQVDANNSGKYDKWLESKRSRNKQYADMPLTMGHYTREDLPFNFAMADAFTVCDQNFCSAMTSTWPNRLYLWGGTIRGEKNGDAIAYVRNSIPYGDAHWKTFPERLEENNISWKIYQNDLKAGGGFTDEERAWLSNFGCNPLEYLSQYNVRFSSRYVKSLQELADTLPDAIKVLEEKLGSIQPTDKNYRKWEVEINKKKEVLADTNGELNKWSKENFDRLSDFEKNIYRKAFTTNEGDPDYHKLETLKYEENGKEREMLAPKGDMLYQFRKDVNTGSLPTVSWLVPSQNLSDHPSAPWYGAWLTSEILDVLTENPEVWRKTIFILTYDENDGYFDHIPPFVAPDPQDPRTGKCSGTINISGVEYIRREQELNQGIPEKEARGGPIGLGFRVPMIIASPWSRGGKVCSEVFDHTSPLQFLEDFLNEKYQKKIREENISEWRRTICGNLTSAFMRYDGEPVKNFPFLERDPFLEKIYNAKFKSAPANFRKLSDREIAEINLDPSKMSSRQEPGLRPANHLPYELYADGGLTKNRASIEVSLKAGNGVFGVKSAGSPFIVYAPGEYLTLESEGKGRKVFEPVRAWHFAVTAGDTLTEQWPLENFKGEEYHLRIYGPNGFFREFTGNVNDPLVHIGCEYEQASRSQNKLSEKVVLKITNLSKNLSYQLEIVDNAYENKPSTKLIAPSAEISIILDQKRSFGWYDFSVNISGHESFSKRYAGRIETGGETFSDPQLGKA